MTRTFPWRRWLFTLGMVLGGAIFVWQTVGALQAFRSQAFSLVRPELIVAAVGCILVVTLLQIGAWRAIMHDLGVPLSWSAGIRGYMLPFVARYIPGMVWGYLSRTHWLATRHKTPPQVANLGAILEVVGLLLSAAIVSAVGGVMIQAPVIIWLSVVFALVLTLGIALIGGVVNRFGWLRRLATRLRADTWLRELTLRRVAVALPWQVAMWCGHGVAIWCLIGSIAPWEVGTLAVSVAAFALAWSGGFLVVVLPSGLGLREFGLTYVLVRFAGLAQSVATGVAVMSRAGVLLGELAFVLVALGLDRLDPSDRRIALRDEDV